MTAQYPDPPRAEIMASAIAYMRASPKRERFAKAVRLENYATVLERFADSGDEEWAAMRLAAREFREIAAALKG